MNAQEFLQRVELTGLVSEPLLAEVRTRIAESNRSIRPELLAKLLVDRGELTAAQARKIISSPDEEPTASEPPAAATSPTMAGRGPMPDDEHDLARREETAGAPEEELGLAPEDQHLLREELRLVDDSTPDEDLEEAELDLLVEKTEPEGILIDDPGADLLADTPPVPPRPPSQPRPPTQPRVAPAAPPVPTPPVEPDPIVHDILDDHLDVPEVSSSRLAPRRRGLGAIVDALFGSRKPRKHRWDSPLILLGGGALILLVAAGVALVVLFRSESAEEVFSAAQSAYRARSYNEAVMAYEEFAGSFPEHTRASLARVRVHLARLRQLTEGSKNWESALEAARQRLPQIEAEDALEEARPELAGLLPEITEGLIEHARSAETTDEKQRLVDLASGSLELVNNPVYLPTSVRKPYETRIEELTLSIQVVQRDIETDRQLSSTLERIAAAAAGGQITEAYALRDQLISRFPILEDNSRVLSALEQVAANEREAVQVTSPDLKAVTVDHAAPSRVTIVLADQRGEPVAAAEGQVLCVLVRGGAYGIDAQQGDVLWRRYLGYETGVFPQPVANRPGSDFLLVDAKRGEVLRVEARTGKLIWRLPCPHPIAAPRIIAKRAMVTCGQGSESGLLVIDLESGNAIKRVQFPVGCVAPPAIDDSRQEIIQLGAHSSVYVLDATSLACKSVISLGHARESIEVGPVSIGKFLLIAENNSSNQSRLHVYSASTPTTWVSSIEPIRLDGQVLVPPATDERRVLVMTDTGELRIYEAPLDGSALRQIAGRGATNENVGLSFPLLDRSNVWIADTRLSRFELQATRGQLIQKWIRNNNDRFVGPLRRDGDLLFHVRRRSGMLGATVSATMIRGDRRDGVPVWQTDIGVPCDVLVDSQGEVQAMTANGALFPIDGGAVERGITDRRAARVDPRLLPKALSHQLRMAGDEVIFTSSPPLKQYIQANLTDRELRYVPLRLGSDEATTELVRFGDALVVASDAGPIELVDVDTGKARMSPFLPRIEPGSRIAWLRPAPLGEQIIAAEKSGRVYRLAPAPDESMLQMVAQNTIDVEFTAGLASVGNAVYGVVRDTDGIELVTAIDPSQLTLGAQTPVNKGVAWGPERVGELVIVVDASGETYCFDGQGALRWKLAEPLGPLAGRPLMAGENLIFTSSRGIIWLVDAAGKVQAKTELSEPLGSGPVQLGSRLLLAGWDGTLYVVNVPQ